MKYKHDELVRAWLDGETVQWKRSDGRWIDYINVQGASFMPEFSCGGEHRIKPQTMVYRVYLEKHCGLYVARIAYRKSEICGIETSAGFVRWLTDWVEVEI